MGRIADYSLDTSVQVTDKLLGSNSDGTTRNFKLDGITDFLNTSGLINLNGVVQQFQIQDTNLARGKFKLPSGGNGVPFSQVTSLKVSLKNLADLDVTEFFNHLVTHGLKISRVDNINEFGQYTFVSAVKADEADTFATFTLAYINGNSTLREDKHYLFNLDNSGRIDKTFAQEGINFTAGTAKTISHNLAKFPAVTVIDSGGSHIVGDIQHTNNNTFNITFKATFQGSVYAN
tara:strand:+ start:73 stop:771 length:699 start_codon:yes stop_codon:yes gene_type:complete